MAKMITLQDSFGGSSINAGLWNNFVSGGGTIAESGGFLTETPGALNTSTDVEITSVTTYDLTGSYALVKLSQVTAQHALTIFQLQYFNDGANKLVLVFDPSTGNVQAQYVVASSQTNLSSLTYNGTSMLWWRFKEADGITYWDYSPDAITWTNLANVANPLTMTALQVKIFVFDGVSDATPSAAKWSNFNIFPNNKPIINGIRPRSFAPGIAR